MPQVLRLPWNALMNVWERLREFLEIYVLQILNIVFKKLI